MNFDTDFEKYKSAFKRLRRSPSKGLTGFFREKAPHKPIMLLAMIDFALDRDGNFNGFIPLEAEIVARFTNLWDHYGSANFRCEPSLPFFHLKKEHFDFWTLVEQPFKHEAVTHLNAPKSLKNLSYFVSGAKTDDGLTRLLNDQKSALKLRDEIISFYITGAEKVSVNEVQPDSKSLLLSSPSSEYKPLAEEDKAFVRGSAFKTLLPKIYDYTCCMSGFRFFAPNSQLIDACHIIPFSQSQDDTASNVIILEPTLHRAFDRGLVGIDENYKIHVGAILKNSNQRASRLLELEGKTINLPADKDLRPDPEKLRQTFQEIYRG